MTAPEPDWVHDGHTWPSDVGTGRYHIALEPLGPREQWIQVSVYQDGDGPSAVLTAATAREVAAALTAQADLIDPPRPTFTVRFDHRPSQTFDVHATAVAYAQTYSAREVTDHHGRPVWTDPR